MSSALKAAAEKSGQSVRAVGNVDEGLQGAAGTVDAVYQAPYLAHACMEPMNCTAHVSGGRCEIWAPTQSPQGAQREAVRVTGLPVSSITVHVTYLGGGFGRRGGPVDYVAEAVELAQKLETPVQVVWTREDDIQNGLYRPATYTVLRAGLDAGGRPVAWSHRLVGPDGASFMITRGADELIYAIPNFRLERVVQDPGIPVAPWRGVGPSQNGWVVESFVDELAHAAGKDLYAYRRELVAAARRARSGSAARGLGIAAARGAVPRDRAVAVRRDVPVPGGGGVGGAGRHGAGAPRGVRGRLRHPRQPGHRRGAAAGRDRVRPDRGAVRGDHHRARAGGAEQLQRLPDAPARGDAGDRGAPGAERGAAEWSGRGRAAAHRAGGVQRHLRRHGETGAAVADRAGPHPLTPSPFGRGGTACRRPCG